LCPTRRAQSVSATDRLLARQTHGRKKKIYAPRQPTLQKSALFSDAATVHIAPMSPRPPIFDDRLVQTRHARARQDHPLYQSLAAQILDRLGDIRQRFVHPLIQGPIRAPLAAAFPNATFHEGFPPPEGPFDLILSLMELHAQNDPLALLSAFHDQLAENGLLLVVLWGEGTLFRLKQAFTEAETALSGSPSPRFAPLPSLEALATAGKLCRFDSLVVDRDEITVTAPSFQTLLHDLRALGETNALTRRQRTFTRRALFLEAEQIYRRLINKPAGDLEATYELLHLHAQRGARK
jgi:SAM-dependent methyltransferase